VRIVKAARWRIGRAVGRAPAPAPRSPSATAVPQPAAWLPPRQPKRPAEPAGKVIKSPMVGTFYRSASPGAKAFVELASAIKEGEPVCIIEAMKIMNEIEADCSGKVVRILCENGQAVEFGQPLFIVE
jgi:acetyl-CoA carboxylase biotin carboxyl carrier protein